MAFIDTESLEEATGPVAEMYRPLVESYGYLPAYATVFSQRPEMMKAWVNLNATVKSTMDPRRYELATVSAALARRSTYCAIAHSEKLLGLGSDSQQVADFARGLPSAGLTAQERAVVDFANKVATDPVSVSPYDIDGLRAHGLTDAEIFDVAAAAAARLFFTALQDGLGVSADAAFRESMPDLVDVLSVGRPVAR